MLVRIVAGVCDLPRLRLVTDVDGRISHPSLRNGKELTLEVVGSQKILNLLCDFSFEQEVWYVGVEFDGKYALITEHSKPRFKDGKFNPSNLAHKMQDLLRTFAKLHINGYVHGNITQDNILSHGGFAGLGGIVETHIKFANPGGSRGQDPLAQGGYREIRPEQDARALLILLFELLLQSECTTTIQIGDMQYYAIQEDKKSELKSVLDDERLGPRILSIFNVMVYADKLDISILKDIHENPDTKYKPSGKHLEEHLQKYSPNWTTYLQNLHDTAEAHQSFMDRMWTAFARAFHSLF